MKRILYIQYTSPAAYPPLIHSATMLADEGWEVLFLGIGARGAASVAMPAHSRIRAEELIASSGGPFGTLKYARFGAGALSAAMRFSADWCYASDALSAPVALGINAVLGTRLLYHEHDTPNQQPGGGLTAVLKARDRLARSANIVVAPAAARLARIPPGSGQRFVVWNCPRRHEVAPGAPMSIDSKFRVLYEGSLSRERLTPEFIDALLLLPDNVELHVIGYETGGHRGYAIELTERARAAGISSRFRYHGVIPVRGELLRRIRGYQLGISTFATDASDTNLKTLAGASNKTFEYLSAGVPALVSQQQEWLDLFVEPGYAVACNASDAASIAAAITSLANGRERAWQMGEAGRQRILADWNYETQFAPVFAALAA